MVEKWELGFLMKMNSVAAQCRRQVVVRTVQVDMVWGSLGGPCISVAGTQVPR